MAMIRKGSIKRLSRIKKLLFSLVVLLALVLVLEAGFRVYFAFRVGPSVLLYGTSFARQRASSTRLDRGADTTEVPEARTFMATMSADEWERRRTVISPPNELGGYTKYFPNQTRVDFDIETGERFDVTINRRGFRGKDFADKKGPGVIRVVALGASSTFGYFNRDSETYPVHLEEYLNKKTSGERRFEVINLGIPHIKLRSVLALFLAEAAPMDPDVVTLYSGNNDSYLEGPPRRFSRGLAHYSIFVAWINGVLDARQKIYYLPDKIDNDAKARAEQFVSTLELLRRECRASGILLIVANQQKNPQSVPRRMLLIRAYNS